MKSLRRIKVAFLGLSLLLFILWLSSNALTNVAALHLTGTSIVPDPAFVLAGDDYVGSETCKACHEDQFNAFSKTKHAGLTDLKSWKGKAHGCESCHGPGSKHVEDPTVKGSIISFKGKDAKAVSETCLACHAGRESHNEFRRGEHWRNNVGCTDCHTPHGPGKENLKAGSITFIGPANEQRPNQAEASMLKQSEPQLCMSCHVETKSQFSKPFHHKVLEGTMRCSDCHNAHGGFEAKQTKLAVGVDAACIKCHANKQGPFVYEHAPLKVEGCAACHTPHGSANAKMLKRASVKQLCMECHSSITDSLAPDVPSFHNQATVRYQDCTVCHAAIHGSNTSNRFFR
ncbi:MAG: DmsE family decaheme c-type cytochrome [Acidobacteriota bacterium]